MATIKIYTDIKQSKKLAEILPIESADMYLWSSGKRYYIEAMDDGDFNEEEGHVRAWSLAALLEILKDKIVYGSNTPDGWFCSYTVKNPTRVMIVYKDNLVDSCVEAIEKLHELNLL